MRRVGILTLNGYYNYGNRLQNYATQEVLKKLGFEAETILVDRFVDIKHKKLSEKLKDKSMAEIIERIMQKLKNVSLRRIKESRTEKFKEFTKNYILETDYYISNKYIPDNLSEQYDFFVTGSDQVWNPYNLHGTSFYFLTFAPQNKRIAYTPSFGVSEITKEYIEDYRKWLSEMASLSVREEAGAKIIKDLTGRDAVVLVDPTLMLSKEEWLSISKESTSKPKKEYLLTYFLGDISEENRKIINNLAKNNNLQIVSLANIKYGQTYTADPSEFIDYINSASILCTDSFHGCVFSILLEKPFIVFDRQFDKQCKMPSINSRIDTLLSKFKLESRKAENIKNNTQAFEIDYSHVPKILEAERKKAIDYLKKSLNVGEDIENEN